MKHARPDYERFQDPIGKIPEEEPVFLIRGQDLVAPKVLRFYAAHAAGAGASNELVMAVLNHATEMEKWQQLVARKTPDLPDQNAGGEQPAPKGWLYRVKGHGNPWNFTDTKFDNAAYEFEPVWTANPAPKAVSGAVREALETAAQEAAAKGSDLRNDDATRRGGAYAAHLIRKALAALSQEPAPSAGEES